MLVADSAYPLKAYPIRFGGKPIVGYGFYIGGNTPHAWSTAEIAGLKRVYRYLLPIYTCSNPAGRSAAVDAAEAIAELLRIGAPRGILVQLDYEDVVDSAYEQGFSRVLAAAGFPVVLYGQASTVSKNARPSGGYNEARWTGSDYVPADTADQFVDAGAYDLNDFRDGSPLWDTRPPVSTPAPVPVQEDDVTTYFPIQVLPDASGTPNAAGVATWPQGGVHVIQLEADPGKWGAGSGEFRLVFNLTSGPDVELTHVTVAGGGNTEIELASVPGLNPALCRGVTITRPDSGKWPWGGGAA